MITLTHSDNKTNARCGILNLAQGPVETPVFMPVGTNATVKALFHSSLEDMGYQLILGNTYHLYLRPGAELIHSMGGLHGFTSWKKNFLTDSGGFQIFSLSEFRKINDEGAKFRSHIDGSYHFFTPENVVETQYLLNSDIQMVLDHCTPPGISHKESLEALTRTTQWAGRASSKWKDYKETGYSGKLFGIIQGNFFKDLRKRSAEEIIELDLPGIAIGGLSVGEEKDVFIEYLNYTAQFLPVDKPRYVMGIGTPDYMLEAVESGIDMFDCVLPTRIARNSSCFTRDGQISLKKVDYISDDLPIDPECSCPVCSRYSRGYIRHLFKAKEILGPMLTTEHNLYFLADFMKDIRESIKNSTFSDFKARFNSRFYGK